MTACLISPLGIRAGGGLSCVRRGGAKRGMLKRYANTWSEVLTGMEGGNLKDGRSLRRTPLCGLAARRERERRATCSSQRKIEQPTLGGSEYEIAICMRLGMCRGSL